MFSLRRVFPFWVALFFAVLLTSSAWAVDLNESFDVTTFPPVAWQSFETGAGVNIFIRTTGSTHSGLGKAYIEKENVTSGEVAERWLITPKLYVNNTTDVFAFWARTYLTATNNDSLYVRVSTTDSATTSFTVDLGQYKC
ncbi:hypothetical protein EHM69_13035, partial [candidate division KSB1 bacterium]